MLSVVLIIPASLKAKADTLAIAMGWGPDSYTVPLSASGNAPASHYGLHTWAHGEFAAMLQAAGQGQMPEALAAAGYPPADFAAVTSALIASVRGDMAGHFDAVAKANNITAIAVKDGV